MLARLHEDSHPGLAIFQRKPLTTPPASLLRSWINFQSFQRYPPVGRINITMEKNRESYRSKTPFAICQELLSCCYRVTVARSHIKQINLVRGSVCLRPSGFQDLPPPPFSTAWLALSSCLAANLRTTLLLFYLNSSSKWERSRGYRGFKKKGLLELARRCFINPLERPSD